MARPILRTPELVGQDAERFLKLHNEPLSDDNIEFLKSCVETYRKHKK